MLIKSRDNGSEIYSLNIKNMFQSPFICLKPRILAIFADTLTFCYVPVQLENKPGSQHFAIWKSAKSTFKIQQNLLKNNKVIIYKSYGKYLYNQRKSYL